VTFIFLWGYVKDIVYKTTVTYLFLWGYVKDIFYKTPVNSLNETEAQNCCCDRRSYTANAENTWWEI
jgi:hypothetical protein